MDDFAFDVRETEVAALIPEREPLVGDVMMWQSGECGAVATKKTRCWVILAAHSESMFSSCLRMVRSAAFRGN